MKIMNSYKTKILNANKIFKPTVVIYRKSVTFISSVVNSEWNNIKDLKSKEKVNYVEKLIHKTKDNPFPKYDFSFKFYKFPSYLRRSAISDSIGIVSSYNSNLENYNEEKYKTISNGKKFKKKAPKLSLKHFKTPTLYKSNMFNRLSDNEVALKLFIKNDWVWRTFKLREQDVKYILKNCYSLKEFSPNLVLENKKAYLKFSYESKVSFKTNLNEEETIIAIDLNLNTSCVASAIKKNGTVVDRIFINQPTEKDRISQLLNRMRKKQKMSGKNKMPRVWNKINNLNTQIVNDTVSNIIKFAIKNNADCIVFEYLKFNSKKPKNIALKLQMWCKRLIQQKTEHEAHTNGIRFSRVCAKNTSILAFDGTGKVNRSKTNYSICTFSTGKVYNCDLNATYNIGARFFIRQIEKTIPVKEWLGVMAKVPLLSRRTQCTLSDYINLVKVL